MFAASSPLKNCLSCARYLRCKDPLKSVIYKCNSYSQGNDGGVDAMRRLFDTLELDAPTKGELALPPMSVPGSGNLDMFDIHELIETAIDSKSIVSPDLKLKDGDFKLAPNFLEFCLSDQGLKTKPYVSQALIGIRLFGEYCAHCSDVDYFDNYNVKDSLSKMRTKIQLLEHGKCPTCKRSQYKAFIKNKLNLYTELAISAGQRSGKSAVTAMLAAYILHRMLKLSNPNEVYGLARSNVFHGTFVALTYAQAKDTLWDPFYGNLLESPWFQGYHQLLSEHHERTGEDLFKLNDTFVSYKHRRILMYPAGPDKRTLRGRTRFFACLTGDSLVSTSAGLLRMDDPSLVGTRTHVGSDVRKIVNHVETGKKEVFRIQTTSGLTIKATANHEFRVLSKCGTRIEWRRLDKLRTGDHLAVSLGGEFPSVLNLVKYHPKTEQSAELRLLEALASARKPFNLRDLSDSTGVGLGTITNMMTELKRNVAGAITRTRIGSRAPFTYTVESRDSISSYLDQRKSGPINAVKLSVRLPETMTDSLAYILGYLIADGNLMDDKEWSFTTTSRSKKAHFEQAYYDAFGVNCRCTVERLPSGKDSYRLAFSTRQVREFLTNLGLQPNYSNRKVVPNSILVSPESAVAAFLSAAISCDGSISGDRLYYRTTSNKLAIGVQQLLLRLGYMSHRKRGRVNIVSLTGHDRDEFLRKHFTGCQKRSWHKKSRPANLNGYKSYRHYLIPGSSVRHAYRKGATARVYTKSELNYRCASTAKYSELVDSGLCFTEVKSVKSVGIETVYDVTVDAEDHGFTVNGLVAHNSIDELGWFDNSSDSSKVKMSANEVYIALERSLLTVRAAAANLWERGFSTIPSGYFINVSSPSSVRDKIMELVRKSQGSRKILGLVRPTWEMNPNVSRKHLAEEFKADPIAAMRDYGAQPPLSSNAFLSRTLVEGAIGDKTNAIVLRHRSKTSKKGGDTMRYATVEKIRRTGKPSCLALDAGYVNNSFAFAVGHLKDHKFPIIDIVCEIMPLPGMRLNFSRIYDEVILPIVDARNVKLVAADRWNSIKILQDLEEDQDVETRQYSLKYSDMQLFKDYIENKQIILPDPKRELEDITKYDQSDYPNCFKDDPIGHFYLQMMTVQDTGSSVVKGDQLTDDMVRAVMLCNRMLLDEDHEDLWDMERVETVSQVDVQTLAVQRGYSGGGGGGGSAIVASNGTALGVRRTRQG